MTMTELSIPGYVSGLWTIDAVHTEVGFSVRHMMVSKLRGRFTGFTGTIVTADDPLRSSVTATVDMTSIETGDATRDDDLRSGNYFDVDKFPDMTYRSTGVRPDGDGYVLEGDLTVHGITRSVPLQLEMNGFARDPYGNTRCGFSVRGAINRSDFAMTFDIPMDGGGLVVGDRVEIAIEAEAVLKERC